MDVSVRVGKGKLLILTVRAKTLACLALSSTAQCGFVRLDLKEFSELQSAATSGLHLDWVLPYPIEATILVPDSEAVE